MITEAERFDVNHPALCPHLRWKSFFIQADVDPTVPPANSGHFWCVYTHNCLGPGSRSCRTRQLHVCRSGVLWNGPSMKTADGA